MKICWILLNLTCSWALQIKSWKLLQLSDKVFDLFLLPGILPLASQCLPTLIFHVFYFISTLTLRATQFSYLFYYNIGETQRFVNSYFYLPVWNLALSPQSGTKIKNEEEPESDFVFRTVCLISQRVILYL